MKSVPTGEVRLGQALAVFTALLVVRQVVTSVDKRLVVADIAHEGEGPEVRGRGETLAGWLKHHEGARGSGAAELESMSDKDVQRALFVEENEWKNEMAFSLLPKGWQAALEPLPLWARSYLRSYLFANILYFGLNATWAYYIYFAYGQQLFPGGNVPAWYDCVEQMKVAFVALPFYSALPAVCENIIERGWTLAYVRFEEYGLPTFLLFFLSYMTCVEYGVYWNHRLLHEIKIGYEKLHHIHHKYNKENTLSPFAGLAFHPLDGILQAVPYFYMLFFIPMHSLTFELLLFATGVWTTNIHDCIDCGGEPIMGASYHTIHHTTYRHNYGQYFVYMDRAFGTLQVPQREDKVGGR